MKYLLVLILILFPLNAHAYNASDVLKLVNEQRKEPLVVNEKLVRAAQAKADALVKCQCFSHVVEGKTPWYFIKDYQYTKAGENLAVGFPDTQSMVQGWMNSASHKYNIMYPYKETGIALAPGKLNGRDVVFVVQLFASPINQ